MKGMPPNTTRGEGVKAMSKRNLFNPQIAQSETDDLYNGTLVFRKTRPIDITSAGASGVVKRGTPMQTNDGEAFWQWGPALENADDPPIAGILLFDIDLSETEEAQNAVLGYTGEFNRNKLEEALGGTLPEVVIAQAFKDNIHITASFKYPDVESFPLG